MLKQGIAYPSPAVLGMEIDLGSHNVVADALMGKLRYPKLSAEEYFEQFFEHAHKYNCHTMVLSAEHFFGGEPRIWASSSLEEYREGYRRKLDKLGSFLVNHDVEIIVFLRPQVDWISSVTAQHITHGPIQGRRFGQFDDWEKYKKSRPLLTYSDRLIAWKEALSPQRFHVVPYVRQQLADGNSISEFLQRSGISLPTGFGQNTVESNATITRDYLEVKKIINQKVHSKSKERAIIQCLRELSKNSHYGTTYRIADDVVRAIVEEVEEDNAKISREFMEGQTFPSVGSYLDKELAVLTQQEIDAAMGRFVAEFRKPRYRRYEAKFRFLSFARSHAKLFHALLHQAKRLRRRVVHR